MRVPRLPFPILLVVIAGIYILLGWPSLELAIPPGNASAVWPAAGFAVAACLLYGYRVWPAIVVAAALVSTTTHVTWVAALAIGCGNAAGAVLAAWLTKRYTQVETFFPSTSNLFRFVMFGCAGSLVAATAGVTAVSVSQKIGTDVYLQNLITWLLGDATGIAIVTPFVLTLFAPVNVKMDRQRKGELGLLLLLFVACCMMVFLASHYPLLFLFLPLSTWLAFRFSQVEVARVNVLLAAVAVTGTLYGGGPISLLPAHPGLLILQIFISIACVMGMTMAVTVEERRRALLRLQKMQDHLEELVEQRTSQRTHALEALERDVQMRLEVQRTLLAKERQLEEAQHLAHLGSWEWGVEQDQLLMSAEMKRIYGLDTPLEAWMSYNDYLNFIPPDERGRVHDVVQIALEGKEPFSYEHHVIRTDGKIRYLRCRGMGAKDDQGKVFRLYGTAHDITEEKELERSLKEAEELYRKLVELSPGAIYLLGDGVLLFSNVAGLKLVGATHPDELLGRRFLDLIPPDAKEDVTVLLRAQRLSDTGGAAEVKFIRLDSTVIDIEMAATRFHAEGRGDTLLVVRDISDRKKAEQQIYHLAHHDTLTGLVNRVFFRERLEYAISQSHRSVKPLAILFIDLDRFKGINDTSGHSAGDQVLRECAQRLRLCLREADTIARAGGDEFLVLIEGATEPLHIPAVAQKILAAVEKPFFVDGKEFNIGASIGISTWPDDGDTVEILIKHADIAMYRAKTERKGHYCYYSPTMALQSIERHAMESALRYAVERGELELHYQPKVSLKTGLISGAEALIRWNHPQQGLLLPHRFIYLAEDMGIVADLGLWAIREVCRHSKAWQGQGLPSVRLAVNLAYSQFRDELFFTRVEELLREYQLKPELLELELTESMLMENAERLMSTLLRFKQLGVHLSVDDFGTGYSSLAYLKRLPVDCVKVDRSFIKDLPADAEDAAITHAILALVHSLNRTVVAEGVENEHQMDFLIAHQCDEVQGFFVSPPLPEPEFRHYLQTMQHDQTASSALHG